MRPGGAAIRCCDLVLDHQHASLGSGRTTQQGMQDGARDVVGQVCHDVVGGSAEVDQVLVERVTFDQAQGAGRIRGCP